VFHLFKLFTQYCYSSPAPENDVKVEDDASDAGDGDIHEFREKFIPEPNDFSDFAAYFVRKAVLVGISRCRDEIDGNTWAVGRRLFIDALRYNNNAKNQVRMICSAYAADADR
jgi:transcription initiation factor TFIID subunit 2